MSDVILYRGGTPVERFASCDGRVSFAPPFPSHIAYEYATGEFTLGDKIDPVQREYQRAALTDAKPKVGDIIQLLIVPEDHTLNGLYVAVEGVDTKLSGAAFAPVALLYDRVKETHEKLDILDDLFTPVTLNATESGFALVRVSKAGRPAAKPAEHTADSSDTAEQPVSAKGAAPYFVARDKTLVLGFMVKAVPTDSAVSIADMTGVLTLVAKVSGFDCPTRM